MSPPLSDDEIDETISRARALPDVIDDAIEAYRGLGETGDRLRSEAEAEMTPAVRAIYDGLIAAGMPWLDAAVKADAQAGTEPTP